MQTDVRAALAELVAVEDERKANGPRWQQAANMDELQANWRAWQDRRTKALAAARAALAAPQEQAEPVAWASSSNLVSAKLGRERYGAQNARELHTWREGGPTDYHNTPLYASPKPSASPTAVQEVTEAMVTAYLLANDEYWQRTDELPQKPNRWRNGTPREATRVSLEAALSAAPKQSAEGGEA